MENEIQQPRAGRKFHKVSRAIRAAEHARLRQAGLSSREIAAVSGWSYTTVMNDVRDLEAASDIRDLEAAA